MADRLRWWVIPGALVVLTYVVVEGDAATRRPEPRPAHPVPAPLGETAAGPVVVRDAAGRRSGPIVLPTAGALVLQLPAACAGAEVTLTLWRRTAAGREASAWLTATPTVRDDAVLPLGGQPAGRFDVEVVWGTGAEVERLQATDVVVPGTCDLRPSH